MCLHGFQGLRTDRVIQELGVTKGAFYHYFRSKKELGYSIVDEIITPHYLASFLELRQLKKDIIPAIITLVERLKAISSKETIHIGCPLNNLVQEMSPLDETFRDKLNYIFKTQKEMLTYALEQGIALKEVKQDIEPESVALFIIASIEGSYSLGKSFQSKQVFDKSMDQLIKYIHMLSA